MHSLRIFLGFYQPSLKHACADRKLPGGWNLDAWLRIWSEAGHFLIWPVIFVDSILAAVPVSVSMLSLPLFSVLRASRTMCGNTGAVLRLVQSRYGAHLMIGIFDITCCTFFCCFQREINQKGTESKHIFVCEGACTYMWVFVCVCQWKAPASTALFPLDHSIQTPRVWIACGPQVPPTAHKHSCCCLPHWQWSGRLQAAGPHAILSAGALSLLVNMFCKGKSLRNAAVKEPNICQLTLCDSGETEWYTAGWTFWRHFKHSHLCSPVTGRCKTWPWWHQSGSYFKCCCVVFLTGEDQNFKKIQWQSRSKTLQRSRHC